MADEFASYKVDIEHLVFVTHAVPPERVQPYLPEDLQLDTIEGPEGEDVALVTVTCCLNRNMCWAPSDEVSIDFHQSTYRTYVRHGDERAVFFPGNYVEKGTNHVFERLAMENTFAAEFDVSTSYYADTRSYPRYYCEALSDGGDTIIQVSSSGDEPEASTPFHSGQELVQFITNRLVAYFPMPGGLLGKMAVEHEKMNPVQAELLAGQFDLWEELEILRPEEFEQPYSVLIQPSVQLTGYPPEVVE